MLKKSGFVAIVGRPNVGKSTLINTIIEKKIAITSDKPQTTRNRILGILTKEDLQIVFVDTPGMHKGKDLLNVTIDKIAVNAIKDVDCILFVTDRKRGKAEDIIINYFKQEEIPVILVINKIDNLKSKTEIDSIIISYLDSYPFYSVIPISALNKTYVDKLLDEIKTTLKEGPMYFSENEITDQSDLTLMKELIREKILFHTREEVPHAVAVLIESINENKNYKTIDVSAVIYVERQSQKQILIGKNGEKIKEIGKEARKDINKTLDTKVHLTLFVKVKKDWRNKKDLLSSFGIFEE